MIAARLSSVWQVAGVAGAALCCYLVSQSVASERAALDRLDHQITRAQDDIRRLGTEIGARSRMAQIDRWNTSVLALQAPRPRQFVADGVQLASLYGRAGHSQLPLDPAVMASKGAVDTVAYTPAPTAPAHPAVASVAPAAEASAPEPMLRTATYVRTTTTALASDAPVLTRASLSVKTLDAAPPATAKPEQPVEKSEKSAARADLAKTDKPAKANKAVAKPAKAPTFDTASLLPSDIGALAAAESKGRKAPATRAAR